MGRSDPRRRSYYAAPLILPSPFDGRVRPIRLPAHALHDGVPFLDPCNQPVRPLAPITKSLQLGRV